VWGVISTVTKHWYYFVAKDTSTRVTRHCDNTSWQEASECLCIKNTSFLKKTLSTATRYYVYCLTQTGTTMYSFRSRSESEVSQRYHWCFSFEFWLILDKVCGGSLGKPRVCDLDNYPSAVSLYISCPYHLPRCYTWLTASPTFQLWFQGRHMGKSTCNVVEKKTYINTNTTVSWCCGIKWFHYKWLASVRVTDPVGRI